jgi:hypothetical protein
MEAQYIVRSGPEVQDGDVAFTNTSVISGPPPPPRAEVPAADCAEDEQIFRVFVDRVWNESYREGRPYVLLSTYTRIENVTVQPAGCHVLPRPPVYLPMGLVPVYGRMACSTSLVSVDYRPLQGESGPAREPAIRVVEIRPASQTAAPGPCTDGTPHR